MAIDGSIGLSKARHTASGASTVKQGMIDMVQLFASLQEEEDKMNYLTTIQMDRTSFKDFMEHIAPSEGKDGRARSIAKNKQQAIYRAFVNGQVGMSRDTAMSAYGAFNALTQVLGNENGKGAFASQRVAMDNIDGVRAKMKDKALDFLLHAA
jgi:hypothetical protein